MPETTFDLAQAARDLKEFFGPTLIDYVYGHLSAGDVPERVRLAHEVVSFLKLHESDDTIRQWFIGRGINYYGTEMSPADAIRNMAPGPETTRLIMSAAQRLVDGTWD